MAGICWALVRAGLREEMQFRANFLVEVAFGLIYQTIGFAFIWVVLGKFQAIGGWTLREVALLYGIQLMGHALWALSFSRIVNVQAMVQMGEFDTMLVRPMPIALQFMFGGFRIAIVGDVLGAVILLGAGLQGSDIAWSPAKAMFLVLAVIGSGLVRGSFELAGCALVFRTLVSGWVQSATSRLFGQFGAYPLDIFGQALRNFMTWVIPVAFVAWVPATVLLNRTEVLPFPAWVAWCTPLLGVVLMAAAWWLFMRESRQYQSSGS
jgi:ABC-2 type transport system permease protein